MKKNIYFLLVISLALIISCAKNDINQSGLLVPKTVAEDNTLPVFELSDKTKIHLETFGTNTGENVIIVLHGGPGNDYRQYLNLTDLQDDYFIVLWDQRGTGLSERVDEQEISLEQYLADLNEIAVHFSPNHPITLIGHSWGGGYATYYTQQFPAKVKKLVLVEPLPLNKNALDNMEFPKIIITSEEMSRFLGTADFILPDTHATADYMMIVSGIINDDGDYFSSDEKDKVPYYRYGYAAYKAISTDLGLMDNTADYDFVAGLKETFKTKVLILGGTHSSRLGYDFQKKYHENLFFDCQTEKIENAGHYMIVFNAPTILPIIRNYLNN